MVTLTSRRTAAWTSAIVLVLMAMPLAPSAASGGGGCGGPVTSERGTEIAIDAFCFTPTVLHAEVGDTVTWSNMERVPHNVAGANMAWGSFESFRKRTPMRYSFDAPGVYSYVCTIHPGMVGTVVVGNPQAGDTNATNGIRRIRTVSATQSEPVQTRETSDGAVLWVAAAAVAVGGASLVVGRVRRRRRPEPLG